MSPTLILLVIAAYFLALFTVSFFSGHKADNKGFFIGNRQSRWYMVAIAMIGASLSGVTFVSVPGMVATSGMGYLQMFMGFIVGQMVIAFVLTPLYYRMKLTSIYEYLSSRFGRQSYHTGAWFFFISKITGAAVRLMLVCIILQTLVCQPMGIPFVVNVAVSSFLVWLYTFRGGVKSLIGADTLKTLCLVVSVALSIYFIAKDLGLTASGLVSAIGGHEYSRVFFFDDVNDREYFWKQFLAGVFTMIATNGLDQDMMQRNLSCRNTKDAQKNMIISILLQFVVVAGFLCLGVLLYMFADRHGINATGDNLFPVIATGGELPMIVGILFILGFVAAAYNAAGSALTALTTSFTVDIIGIRNRSEESVSKTRQIVHAGMAVLLGATMLLINAFNSTSVIDAVYTLVSFTYGPLLGLFAFGIFTHRRVIDRCVPWIAILAPLICLVLYLNAERWFNGYHFSYEILVINALLTFIGLYMCSKKQSSTVKES